MSAEAVIAAWLARFKQRPGTGGPGAPQAQPNRAAARGALGEALVAGAIRDLGWPALRNVVLRMRGASTEIDLIARAPATLLVLEVKTWSGYIQGGASAADWRRHGADGQIMIVPNAVRQNQTHVAVLQRAIADPGIPVIGMVVGVGHARFAPELASHIVKADELPSVLARVRGNQELDPRRLDKAWAFLVREARRSPKRLAAHIAQIQAKSSDF